MLDEGALAKWSGQSEGVYVHVLLAHHAKIVWLLFQLIIGAQLLVKKNQCFFLFFLSYVVSYVVATQIILWVVPF